MPVIAVDIDTSGITVTDNGPGLPTDVVEDILDYEIRVSSREAYVGPTCGAQGNALKTLVAMPHVLDGASGVTEIDSRGILHTIVFSADRIQQQPVVDLERSVGVVQNGTSLKVRVPAIAAIQSPPSKATLYSSSTPSPG